LNFEKNQKRFALDFLSKNQIKQNACLELNGKYNLKYDLQNVIKNQTKTKC